MPGSMPGTGIAQASSASVAISVRKFGAAARRWEATAPLLCQREIRPAIEALSMWSQ